MYLFSAKHSKFYSFLLIIISACSNPTQNSNNLIQQKYHEYLYIANNSKVVNLQFTLNNQCLPFPLRNTMKQFNTEVTILYGPYHHRMENVANELITSNLITTIFKEIPNVPQLLKEIISSTFMVSLQEKYSYFLQETSSLIYNNPNDKFCIHHIEQVVRNLLPCSWNSGLTQLLDVDTFFKGKRLYGMHISWTKQKVQITISLELSNKMEGIKKIKINDKCLHSSQLVMKDANGENIGIRETVVIRLLQSLEQNFQKQIDEINKASLSRYIEGNWYNPNKVLKLMIRIEKVQNNSQLIMREILPKRAGVKSIKIYNRLNSIPPQFDHNCSIKLVPKEQRYNEPQIVCQFKLKLSNQIMQYEEHIYTIEVQLQSKMICFDMYQSIFGGGTEISNIPIFIISPNLSNHKSDWFLKQNIMRFVPNPLTLKTPQPDQSLPFQVITFIMGIFGYLWLAIWRKFVYDFRRVKKNQ